MNFLPWGQGFGGSECRLYDVEGLCVIQNPLLPLGGGGGKIYGFEFLVNLTPERGGGSNE